MSETTLILGASSGIARALARELAARGDNLILAARNEEQLQAMAADLKVRSGVEVGCVPFDALDFEGHSEAWKNMCSTRAGEPTRLVLCHGFMADQKECESNPELARRTLDVNLTSAVSLLERAADYFTRKKSGAIAIVSSVAGDRGRATNYIYGASKAGLTAYSSGLRNRLHEHGVHVLTVKPGFVDTPMTKGIVNPDSPLVASPEQAAKDIREALDRRRGVIYTRWFWRIIMLIIRCIPEPVFKRLKI